MDVSIGAYLDQLIGPLFDPEKRVFAGYLASAFLIALLVQIFFSGQRLLPATKTILSGKIWWSRSARTDYLITALNQLFMMGVAPRLLGKLTIATLLFDWLHIAFDGRPMIWTGAPAWTVAAGFTVALFLADDLTKYLLHRLLHRWPVLWCFHKVHHSAETLTPFTVFRTHPVEGVLFALRSVFTQAAVLAVFFFFLGDRVDLVSVFGANVILFAFNVAGSNLRHSHVWISYGRTLEHIFISPAQHQIHHSLAAEHHDRNFGVVLAVWDWIGGSLCLAGHRQTIRFGITDGTADHHSLLAVYARPLVEAAGCVGRIFHWRPKTMQFPAKAKTASLAAIIGGAMVVLALGVSAAGAQEKVLNIYSHRQPFLIEPFINAYKKETGTEVNIVYASKGLAQRLMAEGERSPADVILTVDIARLHVYADKDLLAPVQSEVLKKNIPPHMRAPNDTWFALSKRARVIAVAREVKDVHAIKTYEDLADPKWKGRICVRPGSHVYNRALVASMINADGMEATEKWAQGLVDNLARRPQANDRAQVKAIFEGVCDIAIINNYYYGKLLDSDNPIQREWAASVQLIFPNKDGRGTHVNISGGGVAKHSKHKEEAVRFLEFLTSKTAQDLYGAINFEYPVNPAVEPSETLKSWGEFKEDDMPIARIAELAPEAQRVIDRVGW
ncbi:MAG: extracellular solute-binding protein [Rhodospirillales bacterium]|nr:extracellular solute-binding protein [Rhodospirillales bacterium]